MNSEFLLNAWRGFVVIAFATVGCSVMAQPGVTVRISGEAFRYEMDQDCSLGLSGTFMPSSPTANDAYKSAFTAGNWSSPTTSVDLGPVVVQPIPNTPPTRLSSASSYRPATR